MTRDEIVRLAQKAGFSISGSRRINVGPQSARWIIDSEITRFAALVAVAAAAAEREACLAECKFGRTSADIEIAIRARGNT